MGVSGFSVSRADRAFEDYVAGAVYEFTDTVSVTEDDIVAYAKQFDPQYFHLDPVAAAKSPYKGLIASGGHTIALTIKLLVLNFLPGEASFGSPGFDELRWLAPLRPGDTLRLRVTVEDTKASQSKPDRGVVFMFVETLNQRGEVIMSYKGKQLIRKRG